MSTTRDTTGVGVRPGDGPEGAPPLRKIEHLEKKLRRSRTGAEVAERMQALAPEILDLVNKSRRVGAVWQRYQGPRFVRAVVDTGFDDGAVIPRSIDGATLEELLLHMADVLQRTGTPALRRTIADWSLPVLTWARECERLDDLFDRLHALDGAKETP